MRSASGLRSLRLCSALVVACSLAPAQTTTSTGSIQGTVTDSSGAVIPAARVTIINNATGSLTHVSATSSGTYASGALFPGRYAVHVEASGFQTVTLPLIVQVGVAVSGNVQMYIGYESRVIDVRASTIRVNAEQAMVQGNLNAAAIEQLPINGRKFMDLAQLEPGVQIQDGGLFDPTKVGSIGISFGGRWGGTTHIELDGIDITDEMSGTTVTGIPLSGIEEFQVSQSSLDLSNELNSAGAINVITQSGTNQLHGEFFDQFRDSSAAAALPGPKAPFRRQQFGGKLGGPVMKNRLFFVVNAERTKQDLFAPVPLPDPFGAFSGGFDSPLRETDILGRLDCQLKEGARLFYRFSYYLDLATSGGGYQPFRNKNYAPGHVLGIDFNAGGMSHSIRFGYLFFRNDITDPVRGSSLPFANYAVSLGIEPLATGPNFLAPQATRQSNHQLKYDGSKVVGSHIVRYGISYNLLRVGTFAKFSAITPNVFSGLGDFEEEFADNSCGPGKPCFPGGRTDPRNYPVEGASIGNGLGFATEKPAFGFLLGGISDNRIGIYAGDSWKVKPNFTLSYGVRYVRDTGRANSDLPPISAVNEVLPGLGDQERQPNTDFAPQVGIAWDPWKNGKTAFRAGAGIFYENAIWQVGLFDRSARLPKGGFVSLPSVCASAVAMVVPFADGSLQTPPPGTCADAAGNPIAIGLAASKLAAFQDFFQSVAASVGADASNPNYLANLVASGISLSALSPNFRTPRSIQFNAGLERQLWPGTVISADYLRNASLHFLLDVDANHTGDSRFLNVPAARAAISATNASFGCGSGIDSGSVDCAVLNGATIVDFATNGLDSPGDLGVGACRLSVLSRNCAFGGRNPAVGPAGFFFADGRSVYNALQIKLRHESKEPFPGVQHLNLQVSYALSRFVNPGGTESPGNSNQDFGLFALDNRTPSRFTGPSTLDRTHQLSIGVVADMPSSFRVGFISHFNTALPATLSVPNSNLGPGEIFRTDFTGDGTSGDLLPGTRAGSFGRDIKLNEINNVIENYNIKTAGQVTPAGQALIDAGLFNKSQLVSLGAISPPIALAPKGQVGLGPLRTFDLRLSWVHTFKEKLTVEPSAAAFNLFNFANFDLPGSVLNGSLTGGPGSANGTTYRERVTNRVGVGTGVFALGAPRVFEFGLRVSF